MLNTIIGVFIGVMLGSTLGAWVSYKIIRKMLMNDSKVKNILGKFGMLGE